MAATSPLLPGLLAASCNLLRLLSLLQLLLHPCESLTPVGQQLQLAPLLIHRLHVEDPKAVDASVAAPLDQLAPSTRTACLALTRSGFKWSSSSRATVRSRTLCRRRRRRRQRGAAALRRATERMHGVAGFVPTRSEMQAACGWQHPAAQAAASNMRRLSGAPEQLAGWSAACVRDADADWYA